MTLVVAAIANNLASKTWLSGISSALEAVNDPDRYLDNLVSRTAGAIAVPSLVAQIARKVDPVMREARGPMDRIRSRIPGMSNDLMPRRDVFGRVAETEGGLGPDIVSPIWTGTARSDPTIAALLKAGVGFSPPQRSYTAGGKRVDWTPAQYDQLQERGGSIIKSDLDGLVASPSWPSMDADEREDAVRDVVKDARKEAKREVLSPGLRGLIEAGSSRPPSRERAVDPWAGFEAAR